MICAHCKKDLSAFGAAESQFSHCPFCGGSLTEPAAPARPPVVEGLEDALRELVRMDGKEGLRDGKRVMGLVRDLAPELKKRDMSMLRAFYECDGVTVFLKLESQPRSDRQTAFERLVSLMGSDLCIMESAGRQICSIFWRILLGQEVPQSLRSGRGSSGKTGAPAAPVSAGMKLDGEGLYRLGQAWESGGVIDGKTVAPDPVKAVEYYEKASAQGHGGAQNRMGIACREGFGGKAKDLQMAAVWFRRAAGLGNAEGQYRYALCLQEGAGVARNDQKALEWFLKAAEQGFGDAIAAVGLCHEQGLGTKKNPGEAVKWYRRAAEKDNPRGLCHLGNCWRMGIGVSVNYAEAKKCFQRASDAGYARAQYQLGLMYEAGQYVRENPNQAFAQFLLAAKQGYGDAQVRVARYYAEGICVKQNLPKALEWYRKAAEQGNPDACEKLCWFYTQGVAVRRDPAEARLWKNRANAGK